MYRQTVVYSLYSGSPTEEVLSHSTESTGISMSTHMHEYSSLLDVKHHFVAIIMCSHSKV